MNIEYPRIDLRWKNGSYEQHQEKIRKWKEKQATAIQEQVENLTNDQLFDDYSELLPGDDWDGAFTDGGSLAMDILTKELKKRLVAIGFLEEPLE